MHSLEEAAAALEQDCSGNVHDFHIDDGWRPVGGVTLAANGNLYGTAAEGGTGSCFRGCGVVWQITP